ncbi:hypothetical protein H2199_006256 [Coniosporium tulheliwenetii]|uniref:Uncharacterized protein n=1 Tax=Coniosporium tulheliwenetii TaxID=3383036 RepID=A0ACC2YXF3_9PEZI|nr:hypothetical protein H2199_006256 [Cladosporium sp. JES 115]
MGMVYKSAWKVLVWLGPDNDGEAEDNFALLREIIGIRNHQIKEYGSYYAIPNVPPEDLGRYDELRWRSLGRMFDLPWFTRLWIIKEVGLARHALMFYGIAETEWNTIYKAAYYMQQRMRAVRTFFNLQTYRAECIWHVYRPKDGETPTRYLEDGREYHMDFAKVLYTACGNTASDPRDYIYAFIDHPAAKVGASTIVPADYTLSAQQLYGLLAIRSIEQTQSLHILSYNQHTADTIRDGTPSWAPRWHLGQVVVDFNSYSPMYSWYDAAEGSKLWLEASAGHGILQLRGLVFDAISFCSEVFDKVELSLLGPMKSQITGANIVETLSAQFTDTTLPLAYPQADRLKAFSLTLIGGLGWSDGQADEEKDRVARHLADFAAYQSRVYDIARSVSDSTKESLQPREDVGGGDWYRYARRASQLCAHRKLFISKKGYLALGPEVLQEGDLCCILYGAKMPFILRRRDDHYILLGESYIHGIMRGEAMEMLRNGELQEQTFEIH